MEKPGNVIPIGSPAVEPAYAPLMGTPSHDHGQWSNGLLDCTSDIELCCQTSWCPCITFGQNAEIIDRGLSSCGVSGALYGIVGFLSGLHFVYACAYRTKLKRQYGISASPIQDLCTHIWCHPCALCQEHRELQHRGYDVPLGWYGNLEKRNGGTGMDNPPVVPGGMTR
ncbi:protein PLANT CADMIUM RESISTANCE 2-like [Chenopodium quinoa]|uniref:protein PLANT CADMIUM RESISTANCE 2-like n=1 Tax=Chenopodium quinoa TaxID=63459 RepID=UPI000B78ACD5|nr:protein PLANT CADMIUM RESISTANCE 2-like [Chenopodium quinoa]